MSSVSSCSRNKRSLPVLTWVAPTNSLKGLSARRRSKSIWRLSRLRSGLMASGFSSAGEKNPAHCANILVAGDRLIASPPPVVSMPQGSCWLTSVQNWARASRAPSRPPVIQPCAITTAFMAPALLPLMPSKCMRGSCSSASSTPQVKAPCAPPPCRARFKRAGDGALRRVRQRRLNSWLPAEGKRRRAVVGRSMAKVLSLHTRTCSCGPV